MYNPHPVVPSGHLPQAPLVFESIKHSLKPEDSRIRARTEFVQVLSLDCPTRGYSSPRPESPQTAQPFTMGSRA